MYFVDRVSSAFPSMPSPLNRNNRLLFFFLKAEKVLLEEVESSDEEDEETLFEIRMGKPLDRIHQKLGDAEAVCRPLPINFSPWSKSLQFFITDFFALSLPILLQKMPDVHLNLHSNLIQTTVCVQYAMKSIPDFDESTFFHEILKPPGILSQPYKGEIVKELLQGEFRLPFGSLLERTITSQGIDVQQLPEGTIQKSSNVSSILACDWKQCEFESKAELLKETASIPSGPAFLVQYQRELPTPRVVLQLERSSRLKAASKNVNPRFLCFFNVGGRDVGPSTSGPLYSKSADDLSSFNNVYGRVPSRAISIASVILDFYWPFRSCW